jgi:V/A-type H+-transporting ATPase subunit I
VNNFTDVVSYIRLFAVGLATVAIADTVNTLAASAGGGNWLISAPILLVGHTINFVLGPVGVLVHGVRLNVLEFSSHIGVSWSGSKYQPLKE